MERVEVGLRLLLGLRRGRVTLREAVEILELASKAPEVVREAMEEGERRGLFKRAGDGLLLGLEFPRPGVRRAGEPGKCRRCGKNLRICYYLVLGEEEVGPLGPECLRRLKLRITS